MADENREKKLAAARKKVGFCSLFSLSENIFLQFKELYIAKSLGSIWTNF